MAPFSVIVFGVVVWTIAISGAKQLRFRLKTDWCGRGLNLLFGSVPVAVTVVVSLSSLFWLVTQRRGGWGGYL